MTIHSDSQNQPAKKYKQMRNDFRATLSSQAQVAFNDNESWTDAQIINLSFGGVKTRILKRDAPSNIDKGISAQVRVCMREKKETFHGHVVWISLEANEDDLENFIEMGIQFKPLSLEHKADLVSLFMLNTFNNNQQESR